MDTDLTNGIDLDIDVHSILLEAAEHNVPELRKLLRGPTSDPANVKDPDTGFSPLHSAIASCEKEDSQTTSELEPRVNGQHTSGSNADVAQPETSGPDAEVNHTDTDEADAVDTVRLLLQNGAIWNDLDNNSETPGCIAKRLGLTQLYDIMVDAGVRAEMLLSRLEEYEQLEDEGSDSDDQQQQEQEEEKEEDANIITTTTATEAPESSTSAPNGAPQQASSNPDVNSSDYLHSALTFTKDRLVDASHNAVMMSWETSIMRTSALAIVPGPGKAVLNIGFGMSILDSILQNTSPSSHHIIEAHPSVLSSMKSRGWAEKQGVTIHEGRWQDVIQSIIDAGVLFDAVYFDTFAEGYAELRRFFEEYLVALLEDGGRFSFFNGLGADRQICYDVYVKVLEMDLLEAGYDVEWKVLDVPDLEGQGAWDGLRRPYWRLEKYMLPVVTFLS